MSDITPFTPTIEDVKEIIECCTVDGQPSKCTDEQAQAVLDGWFESMPHEFYVFVKYEFMEGEIFNSEEGDHEC